MTLPYQPHSVTSADAALRAEPRAGTDRANILLRFQRWAESGWTDEELAAVLDMNPSTLRPRRIELVRQGWVKDSGRTRKTRSGRSATVWIAVEAKP